MNTGAAGRTLCVVMLVVVAGCGRGRKADGGVPDTIADVEEAAQSVGDVMASADESSGAQDGSFALFSPAGRPRFGKDLLQRGWDLVVPDAHAGSCAAADTFGACVPGTSSSTITRTFAACAVGQTGITINGSVLLTWTGDNCRLENVGESVTRQPDFTITGRRGATLTVGGGSQALTRSSATQFAYRVTNLDRQLHAAGGAALAHVVTDTTSDITVTGLSRASRVMNGGNLRVHHVLAQYTANWTPTNLAWDGTCNCAVSGSLSGTISRDDNDGGTHAANITITGCGTATVDVDGDTTAVTFDRCLRTN